MRECRKCGEEKPVDRFSKHGGRKDGLQTYCKDCAKAYARANYLRHDGNNRPSRIAAREKHQTKVRTFVCDYLSTHPCVDCGEADIVVLEFDHLSGKVMAIAHMIRRGYSVAKIQAEIEKCEVRCANCHRRKTAERYGDGTYRTRYVPQAT